MCSLRSSGIIYPNFFNGGNFMSWIYPFDLWFARIANYLLRSAGGFFTPALKVVTLSGNGGIVFIVAALCMLLFKKTRKCGVSALFALAFGVIITNLFLKNVIARPRPFENLQSTFYNFWVQAGSLAESGYSFPSGHTTAAAAFATALFFSFRKRFSWTAFLIPVVMGFSRIYFGVHFASDVLAGIFVGIICGSFGAMIVRLFANFKSFNRFFKAKSIIEVFKQNNGNE